MSMLQTDTRASVAGTEWPTKLKVMILQIFPKTVRHPLTCPLCSDVTVLLGFTSVGGCGVLPGGEDAPPAAALRPHQARSGVQGLPFCGSNSLL